jgi:hypothetical protein
MYKHVYVMIFVEQKLHENLKSNET